MIKTKHDTFYSYSTAKTAINEIDVDDVFTSILYSTLIYINLYIEHTKIFRKMFRLDY